MDDKLFFDNIKGINFTKKPMPVPYTYRIVYKVSQIILIVGTCCRKGACSLIKIHMISWGLSSKKEMDCLAKFANSESVSAYPYVRFDPALNRALAFAVADNVIIQKTDGKYLLTDKGNVMFKEIMKDEDIMILEKSFLKSIASKIPEKKISQLMADWRIHTCLE